MCCSHQIAFYFPSSSEVWELKVFLLAFLRTNSLEVFTHVAEHHIQASTPSSKELGICQQPTVYPYSSAAPTCLQPFITGTSTRLGKIRVIFIQCIFNTFTSKSLLQLILQPLPTSCLPFTFFFGEFYMSTLRLHHVYPFRAFNSNVPFPRVLTSL